MWSSRDGSFRGDVPEAEHDPEADHRRKAQHPSAVEGRKPKKHTIAETGLMVFEVEILCYIKKNENKLLASAEE